MSMNLGNVEGDEEFVSDINTTPLVDVMLVLLIIFLITIPVVIRSVPVQLPKERNVPTQTKPENIVISVDKDGRYEFVGWVVYACQRAGILKIGFITEPPARAERGKS